MATKVALETRLRKEVKTMIKRLYEMQNMHCIKKQNNISCRITSGFYLGL